MSETSEKQIVDNSDVKKTLEIEQRARNGAGWFYWIAGLSVVNTVILLTGSMINFPVGLGITQIVDGLAMEIGGGAQMVGLLLNIMVASVFVFFGVMARKRLPWAFIAGLVLYAFDGVLFLLVQDLLSAGFHAIAFFGILGGLKATNQLAEMRPATPAGVPDTLPVADRQTHDSVV